MGYAVVADFYLYGLKQGVLNPDITNVQIQAALDVRSAYADSKMGARYKLPLQTPYDVTIVMNVCVLAAYDLLVMQGFSLESASDQNVVDRMKAALRWFDDVERQSAHPKVIEASSPSPALASPLVLSDPPQNWIPSGGWGSGVL